MLNWWDDLRYGLRGLIRNPGFTLAAVLVLALGIGANTAIFSIVNAVLLRPLPYPDSSRIVQIWHVPPAKSFPGISFFSVSPANYLDWQSQASSFESMAIYGGRALTIGGSERPELVRASNVAPDFFSVLRTQPILGRTFAPDEHQPGHDHVLLLGSKFWRDRFASDRSVVGHTIVINSEPYTIIGVMPDTFRVPDFAQVWIPLAWTAEERAVRGNHNYLVIGRLKTGTTIPQAQAELSAISTRLEQQYPEDDKGWGATVVPLREQLVGNVRPALLVLLAAVAFVLLIACANVANLVLAKILARRKEIAIRSALGASRFAILRQILAETVLLSISGGILGALFAFFSLRLLVTTLADRLPRFAEVTLDLQVLAYTLLISLVAGVLAGILPSIRFTRSDVNEALKQGQSRGSSDSGGNRTRQVLVVSEVALSLVLLIGAGLMIRTLLELQNVKPGFDSNNVLTLSVSVPANKFATPVAEINFFSDAFQRIRAIPGVDSTGAIDSLPLGDGGSHQPFSVEGRPVLPMSEQPEVDVRLISAGYLRSMHVPVVAGRDFSDSDTLDRSKVAVISASLARRFFPNQNPLGMYLTLTFFPNVTREIVGIVGDTKLDSLDETRPVDVIYVPLSQLTRPPSEPWRSFGLTLTVRTNSDPHAINSAITEAIHQAGPDLPITNVKTMDEVIAESVSPQRFNLLLLGSFAALALVLAAVGIYSVLAYIVRRRVREIGIRMALGASHSDVLRLILNDGLRPILLGVAIGLALAFALSRLVASLIFGIRPTDPLTFSGVAALLVAVGIIATLLPAYRATRVEPVRILREE